jgi:hypothetical protein
MIRTSLLLLALAALLLAAAPVSAATCEPSQPSRVAAPVCTEPAASGPAAGLAAIIVPPPDFILCTCDFCKANPDVECQISPSGYTILCADYSRLHNCK